MANNTRNAFIKAAGVNTLSSVKRCWIIATACRPVCSATRCRSALTAGAVALPGSIIPRPSVKRSEEHTSELQSRGHLVCRLLLEKKKRTQRDANDDSKF